MTDPGPGAAPGSRSRSRWLRWLAIAALVALLAIGAAMLYHVYAPRDVPAGQPPLTDLSESGLAALEAQFNGGGEGSRLLVMLSPT